MQAGTQTGIGSREVTLAAAGAALCGILTVPEGGAPQGLVLFAHGSGSSRHSPRNLHVAEALHAGGLGTLLFDLLTQSEEADLDGSGDVGTLWTYEAPIVWPPEATRIADAIEELKTGARGSGVAELPKKGD